MASDLESAPVGALGVDPQALTAFLNLKHRAATAVLTAAPSPGAGTGPAASLPSTPGGLRTALTAAPALPFGDDRNSGPDQPRSSFSQEE